MTRDRVIAILSSLSLNKGRAEHLKTIIAEEELKAKRARAAAVGAMCSPKAQVITDMPHGGGRTESAVEMLAIKLADGETVDSFERECLRKAKAAQAELEATNILIQYAEGWMASLNEREQFVITKQMVLRERWCEVEMEFKDLYGFAERQTLRRIRKEAIEHIMLIATDIDTDIIAN